MPTVGASTVVKVGTRRLNLSNLQKPLYPSGFTKGEAVEYYVRIAPMMLPYLKGRAITFKRYPNGTAAPFFFEKRCPSHRPDWVRTADVMSRRNEGAVRYCVIDDLATLVWAANLAALELHTPLAIASKPDRPTMMVFDLDPGPGVTLLDCLRLGIRLRDRLKKVGLRSLPKTSGSKGIHLYVPLNTPGIDFDRTKVFARTIADQLVADDPQHVTANMSKSQRAGKVFVDWSQNDRHKTTVCAYSLRATSSPVVSTPITWFELESALTARDVDRLKFGPGEVLDRVDERGDPFRPMLEWKQKLPGPG
jgi:bifunctional non-homologous end joining protein LigD